MKNTFVADVRGWTEKAKRNAELVVKGSIQDTGELTTRRAAGISAGGTHKEGFVPVATSELINSQVVSLNGAPIGTGDISYAAMITGMDLGDTFEMVFTADHARPKEYGHGSAQGWFFVRNAVQQWPTIVAQNAAQFKD